MILTGYAGKQRLWLGQPFLAQTILEPTPEEILEPSQSEFLLEAGSFALRQERPGTAFFRRVEPEESSDWIAATPLRVPLPPTVTAVETLDIGAGIYDVRVDRGSGEITLAAPVWILTREEYVSLARQEAAEEFEIEPIISTRGEFTRQFNSTILDRWPRCPAEFEVSYVSNDPISFSPIGWTVSNVIDAFRYLAVFGVRRLEGFISVGDDLVEFGLYADFEYPPPDAVVAGFEDPECSDLRLIKGNTYIDNLDIDVTVQYTNAKITVRQPIPALAH